MPAATAPRPLLSSWRHASALPPCPLPPHRAHHPPAGASLTTTSPPPSSSPVSSPSTPRHQPTPTSANHCRKQCAVCDPSPPAPTAPLAPPAPSTNPCRRRLLHQTDDQLDKNHRFGQPVLTTSERYVCVPGDQAPDSKAFAPHVVALPSGGGLRVGRRRAAGGEGGRRARGSHHLVTVVRALHHRRVLQP